MPNLNFCTRKKFKNTTEITITFFQRNMQQYMYYYHYSHFQYFGIIQLWRHDLCGTPHPEGKTPGCSFCTGMNYFKIQFDRIYTTNDIYLGPRYIIDIILENFNILTFYKDYIIIMPLFVVWVRYYFLNSKNYQVDSFYYLGNIYLFSIFVVFNNSFLHYTAIIEL